MLNADVELITPEKAKELLATSLGNRNLRKNTVEKYVRDIKNGNWELNGESIKIDSNGNLKDGHHRLTAIVKSVIPALTLIVYGVSPDVKVFDRGASRKSSDNIKMAGYDPMFYNGKIIALCNFNNCYAEKRISSLSDEEIVKYIQDNQETFDSCYTILNSGNTKSKTLHVQRKSCVLSAIYYALKAGVSKEKIMSFLEIVNTGFYSNVTELSAVVFRNYMLTSPPLTGRDSQVDLFRKTQEAIMCFAKGYPRKKPFKGSNCYLDIYKKTEINDESRNYKT